MVEPARESAKNNGVVLYLGPDSVGPLGVGISDACPAGLGF